MAWYLGINANQIVQERLTNLNRAEMRFVVEMDADKTNRCYLIVENKIVGTVDEARATGDAILETANLLMSIESPRQIEFATLSGQVQERHADGSRSVTISIRDTAVITVNESAIVASDGSAEPVVHPETMLELFENHFIDDPEVRTAIGWIGTKSDVLVDLYRAFELIRNDTKLHGLDYRKWERYGLIPSQAELVRFTESAQADRHSKLLRELSNPMTVGEAVHLLKQLAESWMRWRLQFRQ